MKATDSPPPSSIAFVAEIGVIPEATARGLVLFEREDGTTCTAELAPGKVTYVPPFWAHRSVNTSPVPLVFLWTCPVEAGHDYEALHGRGMRQVVVERDGCPCVEDRPRGKDV